MAYPSIKSDRGNVALIFGLSATVLAVAGAGGVELTRVNDGKAQLQGALDAAALAAAKLPKGATANERLQAANYAFNANLASKLDVLPGSASFSADFSVAGQVKVDGQLQYKVLIGAGVFADYHYLTGTSTAAIAVAAVTAPTDCPQQPASTNAPPQVLPPASPSPPPPPAPPPPPCNCSPPPPSNGAACIIALTTNGNDNAFLFNSGNTLNAPACELHSHGPGNASVMYNHGNSATIAALKTKGGFNAQSQSVPWMQPYAGDAVINDPRTSGLPQPSASTCTFNNYTPNVNGAITLTPGVYCGTTNINANGNQITMASGLYVIHNGDFNINGGRVDASSGVSIFMSTNHTFKLNGGSLDLRAPTNGTYAGLALYQRYGSGNANLSPFDIQANQGIRIDGVVYLPQRHLQINSDSNIRNASVQMVVGKLTLNSVKWNLTPYGGASSPPPPPPPPPPSSPPPPPQNSSGSGFLPPVSQGTGLVTNGSFEAPVIGTNTGAQRSSSSLLATVPGWASTRDIEFHNSATWAGGGGYGTDGVQYAELEKDLSTAVTLASNTTYEFSFDYRYGDVGLPVDSKIEVLWDGMLMATVSPNQSDPWKRLTMPVAGTGQPVTITFRQAANANYAQGGFLDRVRIVANSALTAPPPGCAGGLPVTPVPGKPLRLID